MKYGFRNIRNALGSHKDSTLNLQEYVDMWNKIDSKAINEYWEALSKHIDTVLIKYWPMDRLLLLANAGQSLVGIGIGPKNAGYVPFNDVEM